MTDHKPKTNQQLQEIFRELQKSQGRALSEARMQYIAGEVDRHSSHRDEMAMGVGGLIFDGEIKLSPVAKAALTLTKTRRLPRREWFDPDFPEMEIWTHRDRIEERELVRALARLLPVAAISTTSLGRYSVADIMEKLVEHGVSVSPELADAFGNGLIEDISDLLVALKADSGSNIALAQLTVAVMNPRKRGRYALGYVLRLTDEVAFYSSLDDQSMAGTELDLALAAKDESRIENTLCRMIQQVFLHIRHPAARALFAKRLLTGRALEWVSRPTEGVAKPDDRGLLH